MRIRSVILIAALTLLPGRAAADYSFVFADSTGTYANSFTVAQGSTVSVEVYLMQTNGATGLTASGLTSAGVALNFNQAIANVPNAAAITPNPAFNTSQTSVGTGTASLNEQQVASGPVFAPTTGPNTGAVLLGTFNFTGVSAGTTVTLTAQPHPAPFDNNVLNDGTVLDGMIANSSAVITVTAVPEPGSLLLGGLAAAGLGAGVLRRRWSRKQTPAAAE